MHYLSELKSFCRLLEKNSSPLCRLAVRTTHSPIKYHRRDLQYVIKWVRQLPKQVELEKKYLLKPKGKVFIGLSSNEPLLISVIPTVAALTAGNSVLLRPSSRTVRVTKRIVDLLHRCRIPKNKLSIVKVAKENLQQVIKKVDYVFWLGSYRVCKKVALAALRADKKTYFEAEGNDICVIGKDADPYKAAQFITRNISIHNGQRCQAVRGIFVEDSLKEIFEKVLDKKITELKVGDPLAYSTDLSPSHSIKIGRRNSKNIKKMVFFGPHIWIDGFSNKKKLVRLLNENHAGLSLYIFSRKERFVSELTDQTTFSRFLINPYSDARAIDSPWGGLKQSGMNGPEPWLNKFLNRTIVERQ